MDLRQFIEFFEEYVYKTTSIHDTNQLLALNANKEDIANLLAILASK